MRGEGYLTIVGDVCGDERHGWVSSDEMRVEERRMETWSGA